MKKAGDADPVNVLSSCFVALTAFSGNALSPTQKRWARQRAENCFWALGIAEFKTDRATFTARALEEFKRALDLETTKLLTEGMR